MQYNIYAVKTLPISLPKYFLGYIFSSSSGPWYVLLGLSLQSLTWSPDDGIAPLNSARRIFLCTSEQITLMLKSYQQIPTIYRKRPCYFAGHGNLSVLSRFFQLHHLHLSNLNLIPHEHQIMCFFLCCSFSCFGLGWNILFTFHILTHESSSTLQQ